MARLPIRKEEPRPDPGPRRRPAPARLMAGSASACGETSLGQVAVSVPSRAGGPAGPNGVPPVEVVEDRPRTNRSSIALRRNVFPRWARQATGESPKNTQPSPAARPAGLSPALHGGPRISRLVNSKQRSNGQQRSARCFLLAINAKLAIQPIWPTEQQDDRGRRRRLNEPQRFRPVAGLNPSSELVPNSRAHRPPPAHHSAKPVDANAQPSGHQRPLLSRTEINQDCQLASSNNTGSPFMTCPTQPGLSATPRPALKAPRRIIAPIVDAEITNAQSPTFARAASSPSRYAGPWLRRTKVSGADGHRPSNRSPVAHLRPVSHGRASFDEHREHATPGTATQNRSRLAGSKDSRVRPDPHHHPAPAAPSQAA